MSALGQKRTFCRSQHSGRMPQNLVTNFPVDQFSIEIADSREVAAAPLPAAILIEVLRVFSVLLLLFRLGE
jgi:hypothetical protein